MFILRKIYYFFLDTVQTVLLIASFFLVAYIFLFRPFQVSGQSMYPNFHDKEYVLTDLISLRFSDPKKGDVIVFMSPVNKEKDYIKRVIAIAGDRVSLKDGSIYVNNEKLDESVYLNNDVKTYGESFLREGQEIVITKNEFFVLGDNRPFSSDSRDFGPIKRDTIIGKSLFVYWPLDQIKIIRNPYDK